MFIPFQSVEAPTSTTSFKTASTIFGSIFLRRSSAMSSLTLKKFQSNLERCTVQHMYPQNSYSGFFEHPSSLSPLDSTSIFAILRVGPVGSDTGGGNGLFIPLALSSISWKKMI